MYTTIEADIENGRIKSSELKKLPRNAHVLITLLHPTREKHPDWAAIQGQIGKLKLRADTVDWQRRIRSEWQ